MSATAVANTFTSGSLTVGGVPNENAGGFALWPGRNETGMNGDFGLAPWEFFHAQNVSTAFGQSDACGQPFVAEQVGPQICGAVGNLSGLLVLPDNSSDAVQPHYVQPTQPCPQNATPGASVWFDTSYHSAVSGGTSQTEVIALCGTYDSGPLNVTISGVARYPILVSMQIGGSVIRAAGFHAWEGGGWPVDGSAAYTLPWGWIWNISEVVPGVLPTVSSPVTTSLLAFERSSC